jgi:hypothetical protein
MRPWGGCPGHVIRNGAGNDCGLFGNRLSASIVFADIATGIGHVPLFSEEAGVVYSPMFASIACIYGGDGGSRSKPDGCGSDWCSKSTCVETHQCKTHELSAVHNDAPSRHGDTPNRQILEICG